MLSESGRCEFDPAPPPPKILNLKQQCTLGTTAHLFFLNFDGLRIDRCSVGFVPVGPDSTESVFGQLLSCGLAILF
jgi:hypothetical protein